MISGCFLAGQFLSWPCNDLSGATCREPRSSKKGEGLHGQNSFPGTSTGTALQAHWRVQVREFRFPNHGRSVIALFRGSVGNRRRSPARDHYLYQGQEKAQWAQCATGTSTGQGNNHRARRGYRGTEEDRGRSDRDPGIHSRKPYQKKDDPAQVRQGGRTGRADRTAPDPPHRQIDSRSLFAGAHPGWQIYRSSPVLPPDPDVQTGFWVGTCPEHYGRLDGQLLPVAGTALQYTETENTGL